MGQRDDEFLYVMTSRTCSAASRSQDGSFKAGDCFHSSMLSTQERRAKITASLECELETLTFSFFGQRPHRGQCPLEYRKKSVSPSICLFIRSQMVEWMNGCTDFIAMLMGRARVPLPI